jgi:hypothetical protein
VQYRDVSSGALSASRQRKDRGNVMRARGINRLLFDLSSTRESNLEVLSLTRVRSLACC